MRRDPEMQNKLEESRDNAIDRLHQNKKYFVTVIRMSITHGFAHLRFHEQRCPFLGFGINIDNLAHFDGYLHNDGPHQFRVGKLDPATHNLQEAWKISSEDETFSLFVKKSGSARKEPIPTEPTRNVVIEFSRMKFGHPAAEIQNAVSQDEIAQLNSRADVKELRLNGIATVDGQLRISNQSIERISVSNCDFPLLKLFAREVIENARYLIVADSPVILSDTPSFQISSVEHFYIRRQEIDDAAGIWISKMGKLKHLALTHTPIDESTFCKICEPVRDTLHTISLYGTGIQFANLSYQFPAVTSLDVGETLFDDSAISLVKSRFPKLDRFLANPSLISEVGARELGSWNQLDIIETGFEEFDKTGGTFYHYD